MRTIMKGFVVGLALTGLGYAGTTKALPRSGAAEQTPGVSPSGSGTTERGLTPGSDTNTGLSVMTGTVESIDQSGNRVRIRNAQGLITEYQISKETTFTSNGVNRKFTDVKAGDTVRFESNPDLGIVNLDFGGPTTTR